MKSALSIFSLMLFAACASTEPKEGSPQAPKTTSPPVVVAAKSVVAPAGWDPVEPPQPEESGLADPVPAPKPAPEPMVSRQQPEAVLETPAEEPEMIAADEPVFAGAALSEGDVAVVSSSASYTSSETLSVWDDPSFRRQLSMSYMAETEIEPSVTIIEREQLEEVFNLISEEEYDQAILLIEEYGNDAASAVFDFTLANIHFQRDELERALPRYEIAVQKHPKFRRAWKNLSLIAVRENDFKTAAEGLTEVIKLGGADAITYGLLGFSYSNLENHLSAETAYRMAIMFDSETPDWQMGLARSLFKQERYSDAVALTRELISKNPDRADLWLLQANAFIGLEQPLRAAQNYEVVDGMGGSSVASLNMLADIYVNEELYGMAVTSYMRAMEMSEAGSLERPIRAAKVLAARGALDETMMLVNKIGELHGKKLAPDERKDLLRLAARVAVARGSGDEEAQALEELIELDPLDGEALILLGQHAEREGDADKAIFYFERAAGIEEYEADAKVRHAQLLVGMGRYQEALPLLRRAQGLKPRENVQSYLEQVERAAKSS